MHSTKLDSILTAKSGSKNHFIIVVVVVLVVLVGVVVVLCTFQPRVFFRLWLEVSACYGTFNVCTVIQNHQSLLICHGMILTALVRLSFSVSSC